MALVYRGITETVNAYVVRGDKLTYKFRPKIERGVTIYRTAGVWYTGSDLSAELLATADRVYMGGYDYVDVPEDELLAMEAAGIHASVTV